MFSFKRNLPYKKNTWNCLGCLDEVAFIYGACMRIKLDKLNI